MDVLPFHNKLRIRVCGILVVENAILLVKHKGFGESGELWIPPGGGMEFGQSIEDNLRREFIEETGLEIDVGNFICGHEFLNSSIHAIELFFEVKQVGGKLKLGYDPELNIDTQIIEEVAFVTFEDLLVMEDDKKHQILHDIDSEEQLMKRMGEFVSREK